MRISQSSSLTGTSGWRNASALAMVGIGLVVFLLLAVFQPGQVVLLLIGGLIAFGFSIYWVSKPVKGLLAWCALAGVQLPGILIERFALADLTLLPMMLGVVAAGGKLRRTSMDLWLFLVVGVFAMANFVVVYNLGFLAHDVLFNKDVGIFVLLACFYGPVYLVRSYDLLKTAVRVFVLFNSAVNVIAVIFGFLALATGFQTRMVTGVRLVGLLLNPSAYGGFLMVILALQLALVLGRSDILDIPRWMQWTNVGLLTMGIVLTVSRSTWVSAAVVIVVITGRYLSFRRVVPLALLAAATYFAPQYFLSSDTLAGQEAVARDAAGYDSRMQINRIALDMWKESPESMIFGIGMFGFEQRADSTVLRQKIIIHNSYVWFLVEMGVFGFAVFMCLMGRAVMNAWRATRLPGTLNPLSWGVFGAMVGMCVFMTANEGFYQRHLWLLFALAELLAQHARKATRHYAAQRRTFAYGAGMLH